MNAKEIEAEIDKNTAGLSPSKFRLRVSSPGSVMEEVMKNMDTKMLFDEEDKKGKKMINHLDILNETDLAPTDDEPIPDQDDDGIESDEFEMEPIELIKTEMLSEKERRKQKIKERRASSKRKSSFQSDKKGKKKKEKE